MKAPKKARGVIEEDFDSDQTRVAFFYVGASLSNESKNLHQNRNSIPLFFLQIRKFLQFAEIKLLIQRSLLFATKHQEERFSALGGEN